MSDKDYSGAKRAYEVYALVLGDHLMKNGGFTFVPFDFLDDIYKKAWDRVFLASSHYGLINEFMAPTKDLENKLMDYLMAWTENNQK